MPFTGYGLCPPDWEQNRGLPRPGWGYGDRELLEFDRKLSFILQSRDKVQDVTVAIYGF